MSSAICFDSDQSKILSSGNGLIARKQNKATVEYLVYGFMQMVIIKYVSIYSRYDKWKYLYKVNSLPLNPDF